jgi:hypothetical protein
MPILPPETGLEESEAVLYMPVPYNTLPILSCWLPVLLGASTYEPMTMLEEPLLKLAAALYPRRTLRLPELMPSPEYAPKNEFDPPDGFVKLPLPDRYPTAVL